MTTHAAVTSSTTWEDGNDIFADTNHRISKINEACGVFPAMGYTCRRYERMLVAKTTCGANFYGTR
jgi:hypothetical protein